MSKDKSRRKIGTGILLLGITCGLSAVLLPTNNVRAFIGGNDQCSCSATIESAAIKAGDKKTVSCTITNTGGKQCTFNWAVAMSGKPTVTVTAPASGSVVVNAGATSTFSVELNVNATTDATASGTSTLTVTGGAGCSATGKVCVIPTGETSTALGWNAGAGDSATFKGTLLPATADFTGRQVTENPIGSGTGTTDTCHFVGSALPEYTNGNSISGGTWTVTAGNVYQTDTIGSSANFDGYYVPLLGHGCALHTVQHMKIICDCCGPNVEYATNSFDWDVAAAGTQISRNGTPQAARH